MPRPKRPPTDPFALLRDALGVRPALAAALDDPRGRHLLTGLWASSGALATGLIARRRDSHILALAPTVELAEALALDLSTLHPDLPVALLPVEEEGLEEGPELRANRSERLVALATLIQGGPGVLVAPSPVLLEDLPSAEPEGRHLAVGDRLDREALLSDLVDRFGYNRAPMVAAPGEVSSRGDILDIYPWVAASPVRVELFDDEIEELRRFDIESQRSVELLQHLDLVLGGGDLTRTRRMLDVLEDDTTIVLHDPPRVRDRLVEVAFEHDRAPREVEAALTALAGRPGADLHPLDVGDPATDLSVQSTGSDPRPVDEVLGDWRLDGRDVLLLGDSDGEIERLAELLAERGVPVDTGLRLAVGRVTSGFALPDGGPVVINHHELLGRRAIRRRRPRRVVLSRALESLAELEPGDYVVHLTHGVGRYRRMERREREQGEEDFLILEFDGETMLFVPASRIDLVERFIGADGAPPKLDKIGGKSWRRKKDRVARAVADLASQLLEVQAIRAAGEGFACPPDDPHQARFEAAFPYEDTPDQHTSWGEVRDDMERLRPMDRLLIGDVGFGKTEVAIRAAYKAVLAGKQVAVLVPTTILAEQHFDTFSHRMAEEPVRIEVLSRFRTAGNTRQVLRDLHEGKVDIAIGTHRLLGKDVEFLDLALVIVDEEQRFGVAHKERLKQLRSSVDVLTLSATPIPRTLHMAMSGIRDISSIKTPPPGRRSVLTRVALDDDKVLRDAIRHEVGRGGQVFVLYNRVQTIAHMLARVQRLAPTARSACAHGQMQATELRSIVEAFARGEIDVLVCTTIIESGVDIPRANTIVVTDAHRFGLADMHQLRGRVGRENVQAYAWFLVPAELPLPDLAKRRLKAIEEFRSLGAGLPIALRDLELRGAGNLLGSEQSGHILTVGYDMYCRLLRSAVAVAQGRRVEEEPGEIEVELGLTAFLPTDYVPDETLRMNLLRRLAAAGKRKLDGIDKELVDRFGRMPGPAVDLLDLFRLRRLVRLAGVTSVLIDGLGGVILTVGNEREYGQRGPFVPPEVTLVDPTRMRLAWPAGIKTPRDRLRYLLERFTRASRPVPAR